MCKGKEFDFHVKFQRNFKQSYVVKITEDVQVIQMIKYAMHPNDQTSNIVMNAPHTKGKEVVCNQLIADNEAVTPTFLSTPTMSASQNWSDKEELATSTMLSPKQSATKSVKHAKKE
ncbi:uncharacterized protein LOC127118261 [Lathyrus oleraceus]|uniref:uncharacterized protein LOC127118261 n=1 Tax=Pisum sativum TaxID=3888 RepID=UPI0021CFF066|nr:uncharacterized protein LOC127118261 [Pisum sativum]